jgi:hypothetical protein
MYVCTFVCMYVCGDVCMYVGMYVCVWGCMYVFGVYCTMGATKIDAKTKKLPILKKL